MDDCEMCKKSKALLVCCCSNILLCRPCLPEHLKVETEVIHFQAPIQIESYAHRPSVIDREQSREVAAITINEEEHQRNVRRYLDQIPERFEQLEITLETQLERLYEQLIKEANSMEKSINEELPFFVVNEDSFEPQYEFISELVFPKRIVTNLAQQAAGIVGAMYQIMHEIVSNDLKPPSAAAPASS